MKRLTFSVNIGNFPRSNQREYTPVSTSRT